MEDNKLISVYKDYAELLNSFFPNADKSLKISKFSVANPQVGYFRPIFKAIFNTKTIQVSLPLKARYKERVFIFVK